MKAIVELDVPEWQIGQDVTVYFPDTMYKKGKCELRKPGWISVGERLPEVGKVVLAFGTKSSSTGTFQGTQPNRNDLWWWKGHSIRKTTYWMPLPEPPEER